MHIGHPRHALNFASLVYMSPFNLVPTQGEVASMMPFLHKTEMRSQPHWPSRCERVLVPADSGFHHELYSREVYQLNTPTGPLVRREVQSEQDLCYFSPTYFNAAKTAHECHNPWL